ncbi:hypothetical protein BGZ49_006974 [Haplosporangium sp. Z 27]|nr:hypothetical protein BGZ49_006974 [Haplosporangium sp. Z 27]
MGDSAPFSVDISQDLTIDDLKEAIKKKKAVQFAEFDADQLTLHLINIPSAPKRQVIYDELLHNELDPTTDLSEVFSTEPAKKLFMFLYESRLP